MVRKAAWMLMLCLTGFLSTKSSSMALGQAGGAWTVLLDGLLWSDGKSLRCAFALGSNAEPGHSV